MHTCLKCQKIVTDPNERDRDKHKDCGGLLLIGDWRGHD